MLTRFDDWPPRALADWDTQQRLLRARLELGSGFHAKFYWGYTEHMAWLDRSIAVLERNTCGAIVWC